MANRYFDFKQFRVCQGDSAFKVGTDGVLLGAWCRVEDSRKVLDIGSGTGLISLMIAQRSKADITALEPDSLSAAEAAANFLLSPWSDRLELSERSIQDFCPGNLKFDHIVTNPPYFRNSLTNQDKRLSAARHNHSLSSDDLLEKVAGLLDNEGRFSIILPYAEANLFIAEASSFSLYCNRILSIKSLPDRPVSRMLMEFSARKEKLEKGILVIETGMRHKYSLGYITLTRDFYLDF
jgi:tRNA1Val (adenine37-N6)-methyltransferase